MPLSLACPHCGNPIEATAAPSGEVICLSCGLSIRLEPGSTTSLATQNGQEVLGRFTLLQTLGMGSFGTVYRARDPELDRTVALKVPRAGTISRGDHRDRFLREARSVAQLRHPSIVTVLEVGQHEGLPYLVSEFVPGVTLSDWLSAHRLAHRQAAEMIAQLADALQYAHGHGVVHRDIKPSNIMLEMPEAPAEGAAALPLPGVPRLLDFGLAKRDAGEVTMTMDGQILGTPAYMSPEQARGESHTVDGRSDVYSLGVVFYELLTGVPPFRGNVRMLLYQVLHDEPRPPHRLDNHIPRDLETICLKAMAKEPGKRYQTAAALAADLRRFLEGRPIEARPVGVVERMVKWVKRRPAVAGLLALLAVTLLGGFAGITWAYLRADLARQNEEGARQREAEQRAHAEASEQRAQASLYHSRIAEARLEWQANNAARALTLLDQCDSDRRGWEWRYLANAFNSDLFTLTHRVSGPYVFQVAYSADGRFLVSCGGDPFPSDRGGEAVVWDAETGRRLHVLQGHRRLVAAVAISPDGRFVASASNDFTIKLWDRASGKELWSEGGDACGYLLAFSPDSQNLATARKNGAIQIWLVSRGRLPTMWAPASGMVYSPDGRRLLVAEPRGRVSVWDARTGQRVHEVALQAASVRLTHVTFSPDARHLASVSAEGVAEVRDAADGRLVQTLYGPAGPVNDVAFSPDGRHLATAGADNTVRLWDAGNGRERMTLRGHQLPVRSVCFHPGGRRLASAGNDGLIKVWDLTGHPDHVPQARAAELHCEACAFDPDSRLVYTVHRAGGFDTTEARTGLLRSHRAIDVFREWQTPATLAAFSVDGRRLAAVARDRSVIRIWEPATGTELRALKVPASWFVQVAPNRDGGCVHLAISRDGSRVAAAGVWHREGKRVVREVVAWDVDSARLLREVRIAPVSDPAHPPRSLTYGPGALALSPDGRLLAFDDLVLDERPGQAARAAVRVKVWDLEAGEERASLPGRENGVNALAFSPDGRVLASAGRDGQVLSWEVDSGRPVQRSQTSEAIFALAFSPDGRLLAGASRELVQVWDARTGQDVLTLRGAPQRTGDPGQNPAVAFSPDGNWLAASNWQDTVSVWDGRPPTEETRADRRRAAQERAQALAKPGK